MIRNPALYQLADTLAWHGAEMADLGHHAESRTAEWTANWHLAQATAALYADDDGNRQRFMRAAGYPEAAPRRPARTASR